MSSIYYCIIMLRERYNQVVKCQLDCVEFVKHDESAGYGSSYRQANWMEHWCYTTVQRKFLTGEILMNCPNNENWRVKFWPKLQNINTHLRFFWILQDWLHICWVSARREIQGYPSRNVVVASFIVLYRHWWEDTTCIRVSG